MIDSNLLRELGWSDELIEAATRVAEPLRKSIAATPEIDTPQTRAHSVAATAIYAESAVSNTLREYRISEPEAPTS